MELTISKLKKQLLAKGLSKHIRDTDSRADLTVHQVSDNGQNMTKSLHGLIEIQFGLLYL
jgi:hypothetical protein